MDNNKVAQLVESIVSDKKKLMAVVIGMVLLLVVGIILFSPQKKDDVPSGSVDQPLNYDEGTDVTIDEGIELPEVETGDLIKIYDIEQNNHFDDIQLFLNNIGKGFWKLDNYDDIYYLWRKSSTEAFYLVDYDNVQDKVTMRFEEPVPLDEIVEGGFVASDEAAGLLQEFVKVYLGFDFEYGDIEVTTASGQYRIEANRMINGYPLETAGFLEYSDFLVITDEGELVEGQFTLFEYNEQGQNVELVSPLFMGTVINRADYPKEFNQRAPIGFDYTELGVEPYSSDPGSGFLGDAPPVDVDFDLPEATSCKVQSVELVYYFARTTTEKLSPVYKLDCRGSINYHGRDYAVPIIIYANALDPEIVYVPGSIAKE